MKIRYRERTILDEMNNAIFVQSISKPIESFELTQEEFNASYPMFDKSHQSGGAVQYSYKGVPIQVMP